ncbi:hypothetical protein EJ08DRAFT_711272 [Tothia fuscella]|uniref:Uncharacterized protein n=1 Tax=Tothia fuscella TaxID=1048955 RepID=A0A9P4P446_9PEZI|nr:hypothetical protein EJ08DRAFT_711272 [Tothia fuscella]
MELLIQRPNPMVDVRSNEETSLKIRERRYHERQDLNDQFHPLIAPDRWLHDDILAPIAPSVMKYDFHIHHFDNVTERERFLERVRPALRLVSRCLTSPWFSEWWTHTLLGLRSRCKKSGRMYLQNGNRRTYSGADKVRKESVMREMGERLSFTWDGEGYEKHEDGYCHVHVQQESPWTRKRGPGVPLGGAANDARYTIVLNIKYRDFALSDRFFWMQPVEKYHFNFYFAVILLKQLAYVVYAEGHCTQDGVPKEPSHHLDGDPHTMAQSWMTRMFEGFQADVMQLTLNFASMRIKWVLLQRYKRGNEPVPKSSEEDSWGLIYSRWIRLFFTDRFWSGVEAAPDPRNYLLPVFVPVGEYNPGRFEADPEELVIPVWRIKSLEELEFHPETNEMFDKSWEDIKTAHFLHDGYYAATEHWMALFDHSPLHSVPAPRTKEVARFPCRPAVEEMETNCKSDFRNTRFEGPPKYAAYLEKNLEDWAYLRLHVVRRTPLQLHVPSKEKVNQLIDGDLRARAIVEKDAKEKYRDVIHSWYACARARRKKEDKARSNWLYDFDNSAVNDWRSIRP